SANFQVTSEDYFQTAGIAFSHGRDFSSADARSAHAVAIVNETFARQFFPNEDPLGRRIVTAFDGTLAREIVGVIRDTRDRGLSAKSVPTIYVPYRQFVLAYGGVVARTSGPPEMAIPEIRRRIAGAEPTVPLRSFTTIESRIRQTLDAPRFYT